MEVSPEQLKRVEEAKFWVCERLRQYRVARGLTQEQLGLRMGIHRSRVCDFEAGASDYKMSTVMRAAYSMGVHPVKIFTGFPGWKTPDSARVEFPGTELITVESGRLVSELVAAGLDSRKASEIASRLSA